MPRATTNPADTQTFDLKSAPPDPGEEEWGYVTLRRMTYGEVLKKRQMGATMSLTQGKGDEESDTVGTLNMIQRKMTEFEFRCCVTDHNLLDDKGRKLNFASHKTFDQLDPRIGEEIGERIDEMNQLEKVVDDEGNSSSVSDAA